MTILYDVIFLLFSMAYIPYLLFTGRYHKAFWQRFGIYPKEVLERLRDRAVIWVHAVSVGEVMAARLLCERLLEKYPEKSLVISTITRTGNNVAKRYFKDRAAVVYLPLDISCVTERALDKIRPQAFVIVDTELWPNLITALYKRKVPIFLVNGRISPRSYRRYLKIRFFFKKILRNVTLFCMQNNEYRERIRDMGAPQERIVVAGSMKFDAAGSPSLPDKLDANAIRADLDIDGGQPLLIAGSTHRPEEKIILRVYRRLLKDLPDLRLLVAPRHIERVSEIEKVIRGFGFTPLRTSSISRNAQRTTHDGPPVLLLDAMGRLGTLFSIATVVFMGGSLMRKGGQNILEAAVFSKPIIFGPHMFNFKDIAESFLKEGAACMVKDEEGLAETLRLFLNDLRKREEVGARARSLIDRNRGATERTVEEIDKVLALKL